MENNWIPQSEYIYVLSLYLFFREGGSLKSHGGSRKTLMINEELNLQCK